MPITLDRMHLISIRMSRNLLVQGFPRLLKIGQVSSQLAVVVHLCIDAVKFGILREVKHGRQLLQLLCRELVASLDRCTDSEVLVECVRHVGEGSALECRTWHHLSSSLE